MKKNKRKLRVSFIVSIISIILSILTIGLIFKLNILPVKYLGLVILVYVILNVLITMLLRLKKKVFKVIGYILFTLLAIINILGSMYIIKTDSFFSTSFNNTKKTYTTSYYVLTNKLNDYKLDDINNKVVNYYNESNNVNDAISTLNGSVNYKTKGYDDLNLLFTNLHDNEIDFALVDASSFDIALLLNTALSKDDFNVVYQFDVTSYEDDSLNIGDVGDTFNIYLEGKDFTYTNNDFNMIVSVNLRKRKILLTSMPRDYYIEVYGKNGRKDTLSYMGAYGTSTSLKSLENLLNIKISYYVEVNTKSLVGLVDAIGGITYCSNESFTTTHALILDTYNDPVGQTLHVSAGCQELNGIETLTVSRERLNITGGDTQRQKNCETIMEDILAKLKSTNTITNYGNVLNAISDLYSTNMPKETFTRLVKDILDNTNWTIDKYELDGHDTKDYVHLTNYIDWVMVPDQDTISHDKALIDDLMN